MTKKAEVEKYSTLREKIITRILIICFSSWSLSVVSVRIYQLKPHDFGPFQYLPIFFWLVLTVICYFNIIPTNKSNKILSMLLLGIVTIGTLSVIEPYGRLYDSWQNVATSRLVFQKGTINYGEEYVRCYPVMYMLLGILQEIASISVRDLVRFTPLIMMVGYLLGTILVVKSICSLFKYNPKDVLNIASISYIFLMVYGISLLDLRTNAAPQSIAYILFFNILYLFFRKDIQSRILFVLMTVSLVLTHFITPLVMFSALTFLLFGYLIFEKEEEPKLKKISRVVFPYVVFISWSIYLAVTFFKFALHSIKNLLELEMRQNLATVGGGLPSNGQLLQYRQIIIIIVGFLLFSSCLVLIKKKTKLGLSLIIFELALFPGFIFYILQSEFTGRVLQFSTLPISLIFGFGVNELLKTKKYYKYYTLIFLILISSIAAIYTTNNGDIYEGVGQSDNIGSNFVIDHTDTQKMIYGFRLATDNYTNLWYTWPLVSANKNIYKIVLSLKDNVIVMSDRWLYKQSYTEKREKSSIKLIENNFITNTNVSKIYDQGKFRIYNIEQK